MESLSHGFCARALRRCVTRDDLAALHRDFPSVTLQLVDIQRYPVEGPVRSGTSRFYLALSDSASLIWGVVPPCTVLENQISQFELDVGCSIVLNQFELVVAACGLNIVVILSAGFSANPQSLLGNPRYDSDVLFRLSEQSLIKAGSEPGLPHKDGFGTVTNAMLSAAEIVLQDIIDQPECVLAPWKLAARVACRNTDDHLHRFSSTAGTQIPATSHTQKGTLRFIGVDRGGACICCVIWLSDPADAPVLEVGDCVLLTGGSVKWSDTGLPMELHFNRRGVEAVIPAALTPPLFPLYPRLLIGSLATSLRSVQSILTEAHVDDVVSVAGVVRAVQPSHHVNTKHGRVLCAVVTLEDASDASTTVDVTLWAGAAETVRPPQDELWLFFNCTVREFRQRKTLSSRSTSLFCRLCPADEHPDPADLESDSDTAALFFDRLRELARRADTAEGLLDDDAAGSAAATASAGTGAVGVGDPPAEDAPTPTVPLSLRLIDAAPATMPSLLRLQAVRLQVHSAPQAPSPAEQQPSIGLLLSDGVDCVSASTSPSVAASLLDNAALALVQKTSETDSTETCVRLLSQLIGSPLLVWLLPCSDETAAPTGANGSTGSPHVRPPHLVIHCRHAHLALCTQAILTAIDEWEETEACRD